MAVADAIKDLFRDELQILIGKQDEQAQKIEELFKALQDLSGKLVEREQEAGQLREGFTSYRQEVEDSNGKFQALVNEDVTALKARVDRLEDDADGVGGLKQVHERWQALEKTVGDVLAKSDESSRLVKENTTRTEEFDRRLRELSRQCEDVVAKVKASQEQVASVEGIAATVEKAQQAIEDSVSRKYERLWEDVLRAIEETKGTQLEAMQKELEQQHISAKTETKSMVNYALQFMASAHGDRRQKAINKQLVLAWKEQTWISARRRMGISSLHRLMMGRQRSAFGRFVNTVVTEAKTDQVCDKLRGQYESKLTTAVQKSEDADSMLERSLALLRHEVSAIKQEKCSIESANANMTQLRTEVFHELKAIGPINNKLQQHGESIIRYEEEHRAHRDAEGNLSRQLAETSSGLQDLTELAATFAKSEEVNNMIRDILMIWNSLKSLDSTKADREYVENFAIMSKDKDKLSSRRLEDLEADLAAKSRQDVLRVQEKMSEVDTRIDESVRNMRHWEQMWEKLSGLVEDLVTKINDLQAQAAERGMGKLPDTLRPGVVHRMGSRKSLSRPEIATVQATIIPQGISGDAVTPKNHAGVNPQAPADALDSKMIWINSAKGIVDATIDQALQSTPLSSARKIARPKSATIRRQMDRSR